MFDAVIEHAKQGAEEFVKGRPAVRDAEGVLRCPVCGDRLQREIPGIGQVFLACTCVQKEAERERLLEQQRERRERVKQLLRESRLDNPAYRRCRFSEDKCADVPELREAARICRTYAERFSEFEEQGAGLLLTGPVGTGKTFYAAAIVNALLEQGVPALIVSTVQLLNLLRGNVDRREIFDRLNIFSLLVLDDLGAEHLSDYALEQLEAVVDARALAEKPLCVTTNLTPQEIKSPADLRFRRLFDRLQLLCCITVPLVRRSFREDQAKARAAKCRELLRPQTPCADPRL